jgi:uncharacterized protein YfdQ (DUF2303 family)
MADLTEYEAQFAAVTSAQIAFDESMTGQFGIVPDGFKIEAMEKFQRTPDRHRATHMFVAVASLAEYLNRFATPDTMICADYAAAKISAIIDGDAPDTPSHREHKAGFSAQLSDKVKAWLGICGKPLSQVQFGLFLEDRAVDVVTPDAADVMEMVMKFDATKKVSFKSSTRLHDGSRQFQYVEDNDTRGGVTLPDHFIIQAPVYRGMEPQRIKFMVRYRIEEGSLRFQVEMHDRDEVMRDAFERCVDALKADIKLDLPIYTVG